MLLLGDGLGWWSVVEGWNRSVLVSHPGVGFWFSGGCSPHSIFLKDSKGRCYSGFTFHSVKGTWHSAVGSGILCSSNSPPPPSLSLLPPLSPPLLPLCLSPYILPLPSPLSLSFSIPTYYHSYLHVCHLTSEESLNQRITFTSPFDCRYSYLST